jgi:hypothetical protein
LGQTAVGQIVDQGVQGIQAQQQNAAVNQANQKDAQAQEAQRKDATALGGQIYGLAAGGGVDLHDGQFIIPADVVSALGNGSTKAGAAFLDEFFGMA